MSKLIYNRESEDRCPHAPDVLEREFAEGGFAKGWAMHAKPVPKYFFDNHVHYGGGKNNVTETVNLFMDEAGFKSAVKRALIIFQIYGEKWRPDEINKGVMDAFPYFTLDELKTQLDLFDPEDRLFWAAYINYKSPGKELLYKAADMGARCIKLHNAPQIEENAPLDLWLSREWHDTFAAMNERRLSVLWHVTQRLPSSLYTGGGRNTYWQNGWKNGVKYNNEDLLQVFLKCCSRFPDVNFIGAHQLHIGWERLDELFTGYPNLYVDTTIGCMLRAYDDFYPHDKDFLRSVFIKWADRIIFGTDSLGSFTEANYFPHQRFINMLDLPQSALDKICHGNLERLCRITGL
jgi:hypothetical protein